jgi:hypothetical protein
VSALAEHVRALAAHPPLSEIPADQWRELDSELAAAAELEELPGKWQAAILEAELRAAGEKPGGAHCCGS